MQTEVNHKPTVSVIIPVRNEEKYLEKCLRSILASDYSSEIEILVVDGESSDRSRELVQMYAARDARIRLLENPGQVAAAAMNIGIKHARGSYIVRMDAHAEYPRDYISNCVSELERTGADNVGGGWRIKPGAETVIAEAIAAVTSHPFGVGNAGYRIGWKDRYVDTVPFGAVRKSTFERIGFYAEEMTRHEDFELNTRIRKAGGRIFLSSKISSTYFGRETLRAFLKQIWSNGVWNGRSWILHPETFAFRRSIPLFFVMGLLASVVLAFAYPVAMNLLLLIVLAYFVTAMLASAQIVISRRRLSFCLLPGLFFLMHLAFGGGIIVGLLTSGTLGKRQRALADKASLPKFLVVGPPRTGTTWVHFQLKQVASLPSSLKETEFFDKNYEKGFEWYRRQFDPKNQKNPGEIPPSFFPPGRARERVALLSPEAKIVCCFRDPVDRLYSLYKIKRSYGFYKWTFDKALVRDSELVESGRYAFHLREWQRIFGRDNVLPVFYEDLRNSPHQYLQQICDFAGIPNPPAGQLNVAPVYSTEDVSEPRNPAIANVASRVYHWGMINGLGWFVRLGKKCGLRSVFLGGGAAFPPLDAEVEARVRLQQQHEVNALEDITGRDLSGWKGTSEAVEREILTYTT